MARSSASVLEMVEIDVPMMTRQKISGAQDETQKSLEAAHAADQRTTGLYPPGLTASGSGVHEDVHQTLHVATRGKRSRRGIVQDEAERV